MINITTSSSLYEFKTANEAEDWRIVNDGVMGGRSDSQVQWNEKDGTLTFSGNVSLENNGGFASTRTTPQNFPIKEFTTIKLRVKGDGNKFKFRMRNSNRFDGIAYSKTFETTKGEWIEVAIALTDFDATFRGRVFPDYEKLDPADLRQVGFLIADKQEGEFHLEVDWIRVE